MRRLAFTAPLFLLLVNAAYAPAQDGRPAMAEAVYPAFASPSAPVAQPNLFAASSGQADDSPTVENLWSMDILLGLPTAVRAQRLLLGGERVGVGVEALVGFEVIFPMAGVGVRGRWSPLCGKQDALVLSPGVDALVLYNTFHNNGGWFGGGPEGFGFFTADVDVTWQHYFGGFESQVGLELGAGISTAGRGQPVPVASVLMGCRF